MKRLLVLTLSAIMALGSITAIAADYDHSATTANMEVTMDKASTWHITIPDTIVVDKSTKQASYDVSIWGDVAAADTLSIIPTPDIEFSAASTDTKLAATVTQATTSWSGADISTDSENPTTTNGLVEVTVDIPAGKWSSDVEFSLEFEEYVKSLTAGLYNADGIMVASWEELDFDPSVNYTSSNYKTTGFYSKIQGDNPYGTNLNLVIPEGVTSIGNFAFYDCFNLISVTIPDSVTTIGNAFYNVPHIEYHGTATGSPWGARSINGYIDEEGFVFASESDKTVLLAYIGTNSSVTIPNSVTSIESGAFYNCTNLTSVTIPNSVTSIEGGAFKNVPHIKYRGTATGAPWGAKSIN